MGDGEGDTRKIKVVDRRRFTPEGSPRDVPESRPSAGDAPLEREQVPRAQASPDEGHPPPQERAPSAASEPHESPPSEPSTGPGGAPGFLDLVAMLAQQAEMLLTGAEGYPRAPEQARPFIELLAVLEQKTRGNLSADESKALEGVLFQLRTMFVRSTR